MARMLIGTHIKQTNWWSEGKPIKDTREGETIRQVKRIRASTRRENTGGSKTLSQ